MNELPIPKYKIGQPVYGFFSEKIHEELECPDCKGSRKWKAVSPAGDEFEFECPRCTAYSAVKPVRYVWQATVRSLTIGSIAVNTFNDKPVQYMCEETGVGSGTIHYEDRLFLTHEEAEAAGEWTVAELNEQDKTDPRVTAQKLSESLACKTYKDADMEKSRLEVIRLSSRLSRLRDVAEDETLSDVEKLEDIENILSGRFG